MTTWEVFFKAKLTKMFTIADEVVDIGGSLRLDASRGNRVSKKNEWMRPLLKQTKYTVLDAVPDYNPDIVADIHKLPFADNSKEAILCLAVLEHVHDPIRAVEELYRVLKPGGEVIIYVPFLYYYHASEGYYGDYWRFTIDTLKRFAEPFSQHEITPVRLPIETLVRLTPFGRSNFFIKIGRWLDDRFYKNKNSKQVAGYYLWMQK